MSDQTPKSSSPGRDEPLNRRRVLKVAIATAPLIATLPSGAALARSSNLIGAAPVAASKDWAGRTLCVDLRSGTGSYQNGKLDLGVPPDVDLTRIPDRDYRTAPNGGAPTASEATMCNQGGTYYYQSSGWQNANIPKGMLVSATALSSFAGSIHVNDV
jgi:hypothetical protein